MKFGTKFVTLNHQQRFPHGFPIFNPFRGVKVRSSVIKLQKYKKRTLRQRKKRTDDVF
jgi:hypothetical protein